MKTVLSVLTLLAVFSASTSSYARSMMRSETFEMFHEPRHVVNPSCYVFTKLTIDYIDQTATLENFVGGFCEIAVNPDQRTYQLTTGMHNANGMVRTGVRQSPDGQESIRIVDHRTSPLRIRWESLIKSTEERATSTLPIILYSTP